MTAEPTSFLYPFIDAEERDAEALLADLARSAEEKWTESDRLTGETLVRCQKQLEEAARAIVERVRAGGRIFTFGNGGSATDAGATAQEFSSPPHGEAVPARSLAAAPSIVTALANDIGVAAIFSRQLIAGARPVDIAIGFSTSGGSENVLAAFADARRRGMLTLGFSGYEGGRMATCPDIDHCFIARSDSVHRIQEAQAALVHALWDAVQQELARTPFQEASR